MGATSRHSPTDMHRYIQTRACRGGVANYLSLTAPKQMILTAAPSSSSRSSSSTASPFWRTLVMGGRRTHPDSPTRSPCSKTKMKEKKRRRKEKKRTVVWCVCGSTGNFRAVNEHCGRVGPPDATTRQSPGDVHKWVRWTIGKMGRTSLCSVTETCQPSSSSDE